jgi:hypothetical protein
MLYKKTREVNLTSTSIESNPPRSSHAAREKPAKTRKWGVVNIL